MTDRIRLLIEVWLYYQEYKGQYWDTLDDIEEELTELKAYRNHKETLKALREMLESEKKSKYQKGQLPADWDRLFKEIEEIDENDRIVKIF